MSCLSSNLARILYVVLLGLALYAKVADVRSRVHLASGSPVGLAGFYKSAK